MLLSSLSRSSLRSSSRFSTLSLSPVLRSSSRSKLPSRHATTHATPSRGNSDILWGIGASLLFIPSFLYLTKPPEGYGKKASSPESFGPSSSHGHAANHTSAIKGKPDHFKYVLVGGGTATYSAVVGIKEVDPSAEILIITAENYVPYERPPLSKELWFTSDPDVANSLKFKNWQGQMASVFYEPETEYDVVQNLEPTGSGLKILKGHKATKLNVENQTLILDDGREIKYGKLLLATGGNPRALPLQKGLPASVQNRVTTYRTLDDFKRLDAVTRSGATIAVIGGGFLGSELSVALAHRGKETGTKVVQIFPEEGNMALVFPKYLTKWTMARVEEEGVEVKPQLLVKSARYNKETDKIHLVLSDASEVPVDHVVVAVGIEPNVELAKSAGLEIDSQRGGIIVNAELEARHNVFAAGDAVSFHDVKLGRRRIEHYDHAVLSGRFGGNNMARKPENRKTFLHQSMFWYWSDLGPQIGYEAVGILDGSLMTLGCWAQPESKPKAEGEGAGQEAVDEKEKYKKGLVFYVRDDRIVGLLMFNIHGKADVARKILLEGHKPEEANNLAKLFELYK
ncbi:hypothetical protein BKA69DRAFT_1062585 [Paraphysoderma sedebokerense]|nr:hypothetical protein BKA69DRAFT_1062585 [Paraphysoderma sedebokerense]